MDRAESLSQWLREVHAGCLAVVEPLPPEQWRQQPATGGWSAAEVFAHLGQAESAIQAGMKRVFSTEPPSGREVFALFTSKAVWNLLTYKGNECRN